MLQALEAERVREELFVDHMKEHDRKLRETRKAEEKRQATAFRELLEASPFIKVHAHQGWCLARSGQAADGAQWSSNAC